MLIRLLITFCECGGTWEYCRFDKACYTSASLSLYPLDIEPDVCLCDFYYVDTIECEHERHAKTNVTTHFNILKFNANI